MTQSPTLSLTSPNLPNSDILKLTWPNFIKLKLMTFLMTDCGFRMVLQDWTLIKIKFFHEAFLNELFTDNNKKNYCTFANICNKCYFSRQKTKMKSKISRILLCSHQKQTVVHICTMPHCLKIAKNVSFEFFNNGIFHQFLTY